MVQPRADLFDLFAPPKPQQEGFTIHPGYGNLNMKAREAAILGPYRIAHGQLETLNLDAAEPYRAHSLSTASQEHVAFVAFFLPVDATGPAPVTFSSQSEYGSGSGIPAQLVPLVGHASGASFSCVLLPGDQIFVQSAVDLSVIMSVVYF